MTADGLILRVAFFGCIIFVFAFSFLIRKYPTYPFRAMRAGFILGMFSVVIFAWTYNISLPTIIILFFLNTLLAAFYILGIYLNIDSSIHVRILQELARAGQKGLTYKKLLKRYNKETILQKRIAWLINSGEIEKIDGTFYRRRHFSGLMMREKMLILLSIFYGSRSMSNNKN
ncbi:MAG: hypothetical protein HYT11_00350 [Candidatus Levybacteria bacterium]|nr:hypothetical protein [Candidatus Levybacteria bacterium]